MSSYVHIQHIPSAGLPCWYSPSDDMFLVRSSFFSLCEMWTFFEVVLILETRAHDSELLLICLSDLWMSCDSDKGVDQSTLCVVGCSVCVCVCGSFGVANGEYRSFRDKEVEG